MPPISVYHHGSTPWVGVTAAIAVGFHPYPSRTRSLSPLAFRRVLEYASLWEIRFAATHSYYQPVRLRRMGFFHIDRERRPHRVYAVD